ncbi:AraC family transcriptional regulator [Micromonospora sp. NBC_01813]|uniref:AraC family transcriptional regulator n=1 Tax=Micromonospora sp. NBC_01813 TaxID=2975988 RepID=UPI002DDC6A19|nr:AraC family transcriptional regulator [Micromonospora sp. NBC_01813]WSA09189.1 AraC family transcriptional regulator [Micromonospora sp. NBC_01813]
MGDAIEKAAERVIDFMQANLGEQLTVDDMARAALFSKFHFSRTFQRVTGVSPGRFLSALRLQQAKHLLLSTSLKVADISIQVGYASVGTFSSRFSRSVGLSPTAYRRLGGFTTDVPTADRHILARRSVGSVCGEIQVSDDRREGSVFVGLFPDRIPEGRPVQCTVLDRPGPYELGSVPTGVWYLLAHWAADDDDGTQGHTWVGNSGPLVVRPDTLVRADVRLAPMTSLNPPVLLALLDVKRAALATTRIRRAPAEALLSR